VCFDLIVHVGFVDSCPQFVEQRVASRQRFHGCASFRLANFGPLISRGLLEGG
jgi:hypothetical protein